MSRLVFSLVLLALSGLAHAESMYVQSAKAKVLAEPSFKSDVVTTANKGDAVTVLEKNTQWVKVELNKQQGWVSALLLGTAPPKDKVTIIKDADNADKNDNVRRRASSSASAAAARGLRQDERARVNEESQADWRALEKVEAQKVEPKDVEEFSKDGAKK